MFRSVLFTVLISLSGMVRVWALWDGGAAGSAGSGHRGAGSEVDRL